MPEINIANSSGRDAFVGLASVNCRTQVRWLDQQQRQAKSVRVIKSTVDHDFEALLEKYGEAGSIGAAVLESDVEIDLENCGRFLSESSRVYLNSQRHVTHNVRFFETIKNADGTIRERRPRKLLDTNVAGELPLRWSGMFIAKEAAVRKFAFSSKVQLQHVNGLTFDFLFGMAKELEQRDALMLLGAGPKSNQPLILRRGGTPYRGFLEGRTREDQYILTLHFSNLELKVPKAADAQTNAIVAESK